MKTRWITTSAILACAMLATGCTKKVQLTVANHSDVSRAVQLSTPDETMTLGAVSPDGRMSSTLTVKTSDLPAQCRISAGSGALQSFAVTEDSPSRWWFHITADGRMAGPYGKDDVHTETVQDADIELKIPGGTVVR